MHKKKYISLFFLVSFFPVFSAENGASAAQERLKKRTASVSSDDGALPTIPDAIEIDEHPKNKQPVLFNLKKSWNRENEQASLLSDILIGDGAIIVAHTSLGGRNKGKNNYWVPVVGMHTPEKVSVYKFILVSLNGNNNVDLRHVLPDKNSEEFKFLHEGMHTDIFSLPEGDTQRIAAATQLFKAFNERFSK